MDAVMKHLSIASGAYNAVMWRSVVGVALLGPLFLARGGRWPGAAARRLHFLRGTAAGASVLLFFWGLVRVPMAQGIALTFLAPLIALYLAAAMLGERIRRSAIMGSLAAGVGVLVIAWGQATAGASDEALLGSGAILLASILYAYSLILLRQQAQIANPNEVALFTSIVLSGWLLVGSPLFGGLPDQSQMPAIGAAALLGSISAMTMAWAYKHAEAQVLAPVEYTAFVWAALLGWLIFGEDVSMFTVAGAALIVAGCIIAVRTVTKGAPQTEAAA
jgi:S-adenosylmethionine uptake transporter